MQNVFPTQYKNILEPITFVTQTTAEGIFSNITKPVPATFMINPNSQIIFHMNRSLPNQLFLILFLSIWGFEFKHRAYTCKFNLSLGP